MFSESIPFQYSNGVFIYNSSSNDYNFLYYFTLTYHHYSLLSANTRLSFFILSMAVKHLLEFPFLNPLYKSI